MSSPSRPRLVTRESWPKIPSTRRCPQRWKDAYCWLRHPTPVRKGTTNGNTLPHQLLFWVLCSFYCCCVAALVPAFALVLAIALATTATTIAIAIAIALATDHVLALVLVLVLATTLPWLRLSPLYWSLLLLLLSHPLLSLPLPLSSCPCACRMWGCRGDVRT